MIKIKDMDNTDEMQTPKNNKSKSKKSDKLKLISVFYNFKEKLKSDKKLLIIICAGILGMVLLLITEFAQQDNIEKVANSANKNSKYSYEHQYKCQIQTELQKLISSIDGAGKTKVMITLESGSKSVYAVDEKIDDNNDMLQGDKDYQKDSEYSKETEHIIVNSSKNDEGLVIEVLQPKVRGVAVVCQGADSAMVRKDITDTVKAVLNIDSNRVCITKMIND